MSGIVIISAAGDRQLAYPLPTPGGYRGALSYALVEALEKNQQNLRDLEENIRRQIRQLQITGRLAGNQQPVFTITSNALLAGKPLFGSWEEAPIIALSNGLSPIKIRLREVENKSAYRIGEKIAYEVTTDAPGYLYLIVFSRQNVATCIFPNSHDPNNLITPGQMKIPRGPAYEFPIGEPEGRDVVVALLSKRKLDLGEKVEYAWNEVFERLDLKLLQDEVSKYAQRAVNIKNTGVKNAGAGLGAADWQAAFLVLETLAASK
jgi:hypothetical protein